MARLGKHEIWQLCGYASLVSLAWASLAIGLRWQGWVIGMGWGVTIALAGVALVGFLLTDQGADQSEPTSQSEPTEKPAPEQETGQFDRLDELIEAVGDPVIAIGPDGLVVHA
ncbi:MAG: hypothetical protein ACIAQ0_04970, partial [Phycisphaerales bacterium JB058]